jgi:opacity protein-like surface antigen
MKKHTLAIGLVVVFFAFCCPAAYAEEQYRAEVSPEYLQSENDDNFRVIIAGINGEVFFAPVNTADHLYAEAAFLERIGSVFFTAAHVDRKGNIETSEGLLYGLGINFAKPDFPLAVTATYASEELDLDKPATGDLKFSEYSLRIGNYFSHDLLAGVEYSYAKVNISFTGFQDQSDKITEYGLFARYVHELHGGKGMSFEGALGTVKFNDGTGTLTNTEVSLSADYFLNRRLSAGIAVENNSGQDKDNEGMAYAARVNAFITPRLSIRAEYEIFENSHKDLPDNSTVDVSLAVRF